MKILANRKYNRNPIDFRASFQATVGSAGGL